MKVKFQVRNARDIEPALSLHAVFSQRGGFIGSGADATWQVQDLSKSITDTAARIQVCDGHFTIETLSETPIRINGARSPIPSDRPVILTDKDVVQLGDLEIGVALGEAADAETFTRNKGLDQIVGHGGDSGEALVIDGETAVSAGRHDVLETNAPDPVRMLDVSAKRNKSADPLAAFGELDEREAKSARAELSASLKQPAIEAESQQMADESDMHFASMPVQSLRKDDYGFEEIDGRGPSRGAGDGTVPLEEVDHVALRPLARRLGLRFGDLSPTEAERAMADIGGALRAAMEGLNRIYRGLGRQSGNFPLATMHLHALEDNPIRFSEDVDAALNAFFSKRGPVHLSAPAAVEESLDHLYEHQGATEQAIGEALDSVLAALAPRALARRFEAYDPEHRPVDDEARDAWCWRMYRAYYTELRSERQRGLQMLFWEVFGQEYHTTMRRAELNRDTGEEGSF